MTTSPSPRDPGPGSAASPAEHGMVHPTPHRPAPHDPATAAHPPPGAAVAPPSAAVLDVSGPRLGTLVWGLVLLMLGFLVVALTFLGEQLDIQLTLIALLTVAGVGMLLGALLQARRR